MKLKTVFISLAFLAILLGGAVGVAAQAGGGYDLTWNTLDDGGGPATGGAYTLDATIGQADAGSLSGGSYTLSGGYWINSASVQFDQFVYLPLVLK